MFFLPGVAGFLFVPMALSVVFAMVMSFILSRTLVPTIAMYLLKPHIAGAHHDHPGTPRSHLGRAHVLTPVTNSHLVCRLLLHTQTFHFLTSFIPLLHLLFSYPSL